jgi:hypothetical protein
MIPWIGDFAEDSTVYHYFNTFDSNDPANSVTMTTLVDSDLYVYKDGNTTEAVTDGATVAVNFDSRTGIHLLTIDTSADAFYATGSDYMVMIEGATVDGGNITAAIFTFSIENRYPSTQTDLLLTDTEAVLADTEAATGVITDTEAIIADTETLTTDWNNGGRLDLILDAVLVDTEAVIVDTEAAITERSTLLTDTEAVLTDTEGNVGVLADTETLTTDWNNGGRLDLILDAVLVDTEAATGVITDTEAIIADTEAAITERSTLLTDTEAILSDTEALGAGSGLTALATGTAQSGTASTIVLAAAAAFADNVLNGNIIKIHTGTGAGQSRLITSNTLADDTCNVTPNWTTNPSSDSQYEIVEGAANVTAVSLTAQTAGDIIADTEAVLTDTETIATAITDTEAILADTETLTTDWNDGGRLDLILDIIAADTTTDIPALIATAQADLDTITDTDGVILGAAGVDLIWDEVVNGGAHNTQNSTGRRLRELRESGFYTDGFIYIDTVNGAADSTDYEAGTEVNPTNSIANANTIAASLGLSKFKIIPGSTITLAASQQNQVFEGHSWTLAFGSQNIDGSTFIGAEVSGIATNTAGSQYILNCNLGAVTLPGDTHVIGCGLSGTQTMGEPGDYFYDNCHSAIAGSGSVTIDFNTPATETNLNVRHHSGGWTVANMGAGAGTCNASFEGNGQIVWAASCAATSNASIRGNWSITDNASGAVTETLDDNQTGVDAILVDTEAATGVITDTEAIIADTEATLTDTEAAITERSTLLTDTEAVLVDTEAAAPVLADTEAIITDTEAVLADTEAATAVITDTEAILVDTEAAAPVLTDTEAILTDTGTTIPALLPAALVGGRIDANVGAISGDATAADNLEASTETNALITGSAVTGTLSTTQATSDLTGYADDQLIGRVIIFRTGNAAGEATDITDYASASGLLTFTALTTAPANGDAFVIV